MISYYNSKHPGLFVYVALIIISVFSFLFYDMSAFKIGVLSVLWGGFILIRILSLYEVSEHFSMFKKSEHSKSNNNSALAHDLLYRMKGENHMKRGVFAINSIEGRSLFWFVLAIIYVSYSLYLSHDNVSKAVLMQNLSMFFMIGAGFWAGQTYAYSDHASRFLFFVFSVLFAVVIYQMSGVVNVDFTFPKIGNISGGDSAIILISLIAYCFFILLYSCIRGVSYIANALIGSLIIVILSVSWVVFEHSSQSMALWISGWSLFSIFWVRSRHRTYKKYRLYQCQ